MGWLARAAHLRGPTTHASRRDPPKSAPPHPPPPQRLTPTPSVLRPKGERTARNATSRRFGKRTARNATSRRHGRKNSAQCHNGSSVRPSGEGPTGIKSCALISPWVLVSLELGAGAPLYNGLRTDQPLGSRFTRTWGWCSALGVKRWGANASVVAPTSASPYGRRASWSRAEAQRGPTTPFSPLNSQFRCQRHRPHSHSIVAGGLLEMS
jgi:hypothetical protein